MFAKVNIWSLVGVCIVSAFFGVLGTMTAYMAHYSEKADRIQREANEAIQRAEGKADLIRELYKDGCRTDIKNLIDNHINSSKHDILHPRPVIKGVQ